jgi:O-antigen ligase
MERLMREPVAEDQASPLSMPLIFDPRRLLAALASYTPMDRNNRLWLFLAGCTAPAFGSTLSVIVWCAFVWAIPSLVFGRYPLVSNRWIVACALATGAFAAVKLSFTIAHSGLVDPLDLIGPLLFFAPLLVLSRLRLTARRDIMDLFVLGCGLSVLAAAPVAAVQTLGFGERAAAFCGNPGVFAVMSVLFGAIGVLNLMASDGRRRWLGVLSYLAMVFCVLASGMRAVWIVVPCVTIVLFWAVAGALPRDILRRGMIGASAALLIGLILGADSIIDRMMAIGDDIGRIQQDGDYDSSTGQRLVMYDAAWSAIKAAPFAGYGLQNRVGAILDHAQKDNRELVAYSHPHNGYLAALLDAGVLGLAVLILMLVVPVWLAVASPRDGAWRLRMAVGLILALTYSISGMTGILFEHDLMDAAFVVTLIVLTASIPAPAEGFEQ